MTSITPQKMRLFSRNEGNYVITNEIIIRMLADPASPIALLCELIPNGAKVLDIGAGNGVLAQALAISGKRVVIDAIEPNGFAAKLAAPHYRNLHVGYVQDYLSIFNNNQYDIVVLADVIEHIENPEEFLESFLSHLDMKTRLLVSLPNVAFGAVRLALLGGAFEYTQSGLLEATHLRFFTKRTAVTLFLASGLVVDRFYGLKRSWYRTEIPRAKQAMSPATVLPLIFDRDSLVYQYVFELSQKSDEKQSDKILTYHSRGIPGWLNFFDYSIGWGLDLLRRNRYVDRFTRKLKNIL